MVVTYQLCKYSEELRDLSALNLLPTNEQDPLGASPTMEVPVAGRVMADMFDDGGEFQDNLIVDSDSLYLVHDSRMMVLLELSLSLSNNLCCRSVLTVSQLFFFFSKH